MALLQQLNPHDGRVVVRRLFHSNRREPEKCAVGVRGAAEGEVEENKVTIQLHKSEIGSAWGHGVTSACCIISDPLCLLSEAGVHSFSLSVEGS